MKKILLPLALVASITAMAQPFQPEWSSLNTRPVPAWFRDAKFGIFIHWGVYAVPGYTTKGGYAEWYQHGLETGDSARKEYHRKRFGNLTYYDLADQFKAELYNPDEWARLPPNTTMGMHSGPTMTLVVPGGEAGTRWLRVRAAICWEICSGQFEKLLCGQACIIRCMNGSILYGNRIRRNMFQRMCGRK
jgi:hypothetical protein